MSGQNTGSCEVRSVGWWPNAKQNSRGDMSGHLTRMRGVVTACPAGIWVACGVGSREEWEKAERGGSVPTQLHKNLLSSTLDLASWGLALLPHSSTRQVPRSGCCLNLVCPDIMMNRADRRQRQLHSLHFASECHRALPLKEQARRLPSLWGPSPPASSFSKHSLGPSVTQGLPSLSLHISGNSFKNHSGSRRLGLGS